MSDLLVDFIMSLDGYGAAGRLLACRDKRVRHRRRRCRLADQGGTTQSVQNRCGQFRPDRSGGINIGLSIDQQSVARVAGVVVSPPGECPAASESRSEPAFI